MRRIVLASNNSGKVREIDRLLQGCGIEIVPQSEFDVSHIDETGSTFV
jgi:XTP/dITP diphosphohydrolase